MDLEDHLHALSPHCEALGDQDPKYHLPRSVLKRISPSVGSIARNIARPVVVLPQRFLQLIQVFHLANIQRYIINSFYITDVLLK